MAGPLPEGTFLQPWFQSGQVCGSASSLPTHWKRSFARQEVTILLGGLNVLSPFKCYFELGTELLAVIRQNTGLTVQGITIARSLSLFCFFFNIYTHTEVYMCVYIYICPNKYQHMLVGSYFSNQEILVATSADIHISIYHSPCSQSGERASRLAGAACPAVSVTQSSGARAGEGLPCVQYGLAKPVGWLPTRPMLEIDPGSPREENTRIYSSH